MNLDQLIAAGAIIPNSLVKKTVTWKRRDDNKKLLTDTFDVFVKKSMSSADFEFIYTEKKDTEGYMARRVSRLVLLGDKGAEQIPFEVASTMQPSLLFALVSAVVEVEKENAPEEGEEGKEEKN